MLYREFQAIYEESGLVAAAMCVHEIEDFSFFTFSHDFPALAHKVPLEWMDSYGVNVMLHIDVNWLKRIDTTKFNIYMIRSILLEHPRATHLDVSKFQSSDWVYLLTEVPEIIENYKQLIFSQVGIMSWHHVTTRKPELLVEFDCAVYYDVLKNGNYSSNYRNYLSLLTIQDILDGRAKHVSWDQNTLTP